MIRLFMHQHTKLLLALALLGSFLVGFSLPLLTQSITASMLARCDAEHPLLNPSQRCGRKKTGTQEEYDVFARQLAASLSQKERSGDIAHTSVYFRDLENGPWFGLEEDETFSAASLLKLPILMAVYKQAEHDPSLLQKKIGYTGTLGDTPNLSNPTQTIQPGEYYTIDELVGRMIIYSDNASKELVQAWLSSLNHQQDLLTKTYADLGIFDATNSLDSRITVKTYASIFRQLYNASYLTEEYSQKALSLLTRVEFKEGLNAGVPPDVTIAHKFGVREGKKGEFQLHDCGIVYHPVFPYLLCIMTRGQDASHDASVIAEISSHMYQEVLHRALAAFQVQHRGK